jgi:hypothetical protein
VPTLVHLANEKNSAKILNAGLKIGSYGRGIYCMPVLPNFFISHQWLRELKTSGAKTLVGVYFKVDSSEMVFAGKFSSKHRHITLGEAIKEIMLLPDAQGYELIVDRKIQANEITKIRHLPQIVGWRYFPDSHNKKPCNCEYCLRGNIKGKRTYYRLNKNEESG